MGLFGRGKEKKERAEAIVREALTNHPAVEILMQNITDPSEEHQWLNTVGGYYDDRFRTVIVADDTLGVHCCSPNQLTNENSKHQAVRLAFTDLGYTPLPGYQDEDGDYILGASRVAELLAEEVKRRISLVHPEYSLGNIIIENENDGRFAVAYFYYRLPALQWKSWF